MTPAQAVIIATSVVSLGCAPVVVLACLRVRTLQRRMAAAVQTAQNKLNRRAQELVDDLRARAIDQADRMHVARHTPNEVCNCLPPMDPYRQPFHCAVKGYLGNFDFSRRMAGDPYPGISGPRATLPRPEDEPTAVRPLPPRPGFTAG